MCEKTNTSNQQVLTTYCALIRKQVTVISHVSIIYSNLYFVLKNKYLQANKLKIETTPYLLY